jgi:hypothetical protein
MDYQGRPLLACPRLPQPYWVILLGQSGTYQGISSALGPSTSCALDLH